MLSRLARFVGLAVHASESVSQDEALAWTMVADAAISTNSSVFSDATRFLLHILFEKGNLDEPELLAMFNRAARALLALAWDNDPPIQQLATNAIRFVGRSFAADPVASRALLDQMLREPHFSARADQEATWLAEQILPIAQADGNFAIEIYRVLYSRDITDDSTSFLGGQVSRIMPLSSNRSQDYRHCRYHLGRSVARLLELSPRLGTRAIVEASLGDIDRTIPLGDDRKQVVVPGRAPFDLLGYDYRYGIWDETEDDHHIQESDVLAQLIAHLRNCPPAVFAETVDAAATEYVGPAVWARILGVGTERIGEVADLLWPFARKVTLLAHPAIVRDAVRFLAYVYSSRSVNERTAFEAEALRSDLFTDEVEQRLWCRVLCSFLSIVDVGAIATEPMLSLREDLAAAGELNGNPPTSSFSIRTGPSRGVVRSMLAGEGVNVAEGIDAQMLARSEALYEMLDSMPQESGGTALGELWAEVLATIDFYDTHVDALHEKIEQPVWGHISNAVERIASSGDYGPGSDGMPSVEEMLDVLSRLWASPFPEVDQNNEDASLTWGNWEVRVYAAQAYVALADRFGEDHSEIVDMVEAIFTDPVPQVRLQAAQSLQAMGRIAPDRMWILAEHVARDEPHKGVLSAFLHYNSSHFIWRDVERSKAIIESIRARHEMVARDENSGRDGVAGQLGYITAHLWCWQEEEVALEWLNAWVNDPAAHREFLTSFLSTLRKPFFARYTEGEETVAGLTDRSQRAAMVILESCSIASEASHAVLVGGILDGAERDAHIATYKSAESVIGQLMNQLYFGSGAFSESREGTVALASANAKSLFLNDYRPMLARLSGSHEPSTHHHLVELYEFLIPGDPPGVLDALHALLTGQAAREGYHFEGLAMSVIVRIITRYIADHRSIFEDEARRSGLVAILRLFSDAGWPEALKLLYDLPDLIR